MRQFRRRISHFTTIFTTYLLIFVAYAQFPMSNALLSERICRFSWRMRNFRLKFKFFQLSSPCSMHSWSSLFTNCLSPANRHITLALNYQVSQDKANCAIHSVVGQINNCPRTFGSVWWRNWMAYHFLDNIETLWVKFNPRFRKLTEGETNPIKSPHGLKMYNSIFVDWSSQS